MTVAPMTLLTADLIKWLHKLSTTVYFSLSLNTITCWTQPMVFFKCKPMFSPKHVYMCVYADYTNLTSYGFEKHLWFLPNHDSLCIEEDEWLHFWSRILFNYFSAIQFHFYFIMNKKKCFSRKKKLTLHRSNQISSTSILIAHLQHTNHF